MILTFTVPEGPDRKAYHVLRRELKASAAFVRRLKAAGALYVNGEPSFTDRVLRPGDVLTADADACEPESDLVPEKGPLSIRYEEEGFLAVNKPAGLLIHPTRSRYGGTLCNFAAGYRSAQGQPPAVHAVNRLDRDTSGVVLLAKNSYMHALLTGALRDSSACKTYLAVICGAMPAREGVVDAPIARTAPSDMKREVRPDGQPAVTRWRVLAESGGLSLVALRPETGRTHQLRVHCAHMGCPLLGDRLYGTPASLALGARYGVSAHLLHAARLEFSHPLTGERMDLQAPVEREDMASVLSLFPAQKTETIFSPAP
ncbi:MAG: RluA family pseudouridine synthase [Oscillospiraceae bacterium]|nr:RluA family pseudouridine synthase [Oscillospiraceae bacterium]